MRDLNIFFRNSIDDLIFLLDRQYPKKSAIELVGNRYHLNSDERMVLYRGVFDRESTVLRKKKCVTLSKVKKVIIDGYNVLITLESYLMGKWVFRCLDGYVRDISGMYGNHSMDDFTRKSIELLMDFFKNALKRHSVGGQGAVIFLDYPVSKSGQLAASMRECFQKESVNIEVQVVKSPDYNIVEESRASPTAVVASSDTVILDRIARSFDIPDYIIREVFHKDIFDLRRIMRKKFRR
jgi:hypothetical protein